MKIQHPCGCYFDTDTNIFIRSKNCGHTLSGRFLMEESPNQENKCEGCVFNSNNSCLITYHRCVPLCFGLFQENKKHRIFKEIN